MKTKTTIDKSTWARGPWDDEADWYQWDDEATGLPCLVVRVRRSGSLCGYVGVRKGHPECGTDEVSNYERVDGSRPLGGVTWGGFAVLHDEPVSKGRFASSPIEAERRRRRRSRRWWIGFDCEHLGDLSPALDRDRWPDNIYRDFAYVRGEVEALAMQIAARTGLIWMQHRFAEQADAV